MVRLVFRPYTQLRRSICTSESLRTSIRVSPDFILARHSSPSFGYQRARCRCASVRRRPTTAPRDDRPRPRRAIETPRECGRPAATLDHGTWTRNAIFPVHFHYAFQRRVSYMTSAPWCARCPATRAHVRLLGPCFKTGRKEARRNRRRPAPTSSARHDAGHRCLLSAVSQRVASSPHGTPKRTAQRARSRLLRARTDTGEQVATSDTATEISNGRRRANPPAAILNSAAQIHGLCPFTPERFHVLLNSLFKVLFNFPSRYLSAIGLVVVFSLRWSLPPA